MRKTAHAADKRRQITPNSQLPTPNGAIIEDRTLLEVGGWRLGVDKGSSFSGRAPPLYWRREVYMTHTVTSSLAALALSGAAISLATVVTSAGQAPAKRIVYVS